MTALGVGCRVYVGYTAITNQAGLTCRLGVITDGPIGYNVKPFGDNGWATRADRSWLVLLDGEMRPVCAAEFLLTPIDDETETQPTEAEVETNA